MTSPSAVHPAISKGNIAVISGGASGIGLAAAIKLAGAGMAVVIGDVVPDSLKPAVQAVNDAVPGAKCIALPLDVTDAESVQTFAKRVGSTFDSGEITVVMANAGVGGPTKASDPDGWERILSVNAWGVTKVCHAFLPLLKAHGKPSLVVNTGSKQGITTPPGSGAAYNISKTIVRCFTEQLAHELRQDEKSNIDVALLIPGWVHTGLTGAKEGKAKPDGAWTPEQTVNYMFERLALGKFYILCPDNDTPRALDEARMAWNIDDIIQDRSALSRWDKKYEKEFAEFVKARGV